MKHQDIDDNLNLINQSLYWAKKYNKPNFPAAQLEAMRRGVAKIRSAAQFRCAAAAYGESQVGKSYLMSSLLSSPSQPFVITNSGRDYSFIDEINPSGGNNSKVESTGLVTRFTSEQPDPSQMPGTVKALMLSVVDIICLIADSYYNDLNIDNENQLTTEQINTQLLSLQELDSSQPAQDILTQDDIEDIKDYFSQTIGSVAGMVIHSNFFKVIPKLIAAVPITSWGDIMSLLWNQNSEMTSLFRRLVNIHQRLGFPSEILLPFDSFLRSKGTLLKIDWIDQACGATKELEPGESGITDVFSIEGRPLAQAMSKGELSPLIAEVTFPVSPNLLPERPFLQEMDLLDFPGARSREKFRESEITHVLPQMLRRGKVAYLFNKYSRSLRIASILFCHHNDQKSEPTIGQSISDWIDSNIGNSPAERQKVLARTNGISPLMFVATKFNIDLQRVKTDLPGSEETLSKHWDRFDTVIPEIVKPSAWLENWTQTGATTKPFQSIYPLRDYYWSAKNGLMEGFSDGLIKSPEVKRKVDVEFPEYWDKLKDSFTKNAFVKRHFASPTTAWEQFTTPNHDGSQVIIRDLTALAPQLQQAREAKWENILKEQRDILNKMLQPWHEPEDVESRNKKVRRIAGDMRMSLTGAIAREPSTFGRIMDLMMITSEPIRQIAYDVLVRHTEKPRDYSVANFYRLQAGINLADSKEDNLQKLMDFAVADTTEELEQMLNTQGTTVEDVLAGDSESMSTYNGLMAAKITDFWRNHLNDKAQSLEKFVPHACDIVVMLVSLLDKLKVQDILSQRIEPYISMASDNEKCNAIGDCSALLLNTLVSSAGKTFMSQTNIDDIKEKAAACRLNLAAAVEIPTNELPLERLASALNLLSRQNELMAAASIDLISISQLPFYRNYTSWQNRIIEGLLLCSDISNVDPQANAEIQTILLTLQSLYQA